MQNVGTLSQNSVINNLIPGKSTIILISTVLLVIQLSNAPYKQTIIIKTTKIHNHSISIIIHLSLCIFIRRVISICICQLVAHTVIQDHLFALIFTRSVPSTLEDCGLQQIVSSLIKISYRAPREIKKRKIFPIYQNLYIPVVAKNRLIAFQL